MAGDTVITVIGNLTADPELRFTPIRRRGRELHRRLDPANLRPQTRGSGATGRRCSCAAACGARPRRTPPSP